MGHDIAHTLETSSIQGIVERGGRIRRLMPRECFRLQGFEDEQIDKILDSYPEIKTYIGVNGFSIMGGGELSNAGTYFVILKNWNERKGKEHTASAVVNRFNREAYGIQEAQIFAMVPPAIPGLGASGGLQLQLEDRNNLVPTEMQHAIETLQATYRS